MLSSEQTGVRSRRIERLSEADWAEQENKVALQKMMGR